MFWADRIAEELKYSGPHLVDDMKTPSGRIHVGSLRGPILHDIIYKALRQAGAPTRFTYVIDDHDPMDGLPSYLDEATYRPHMGKPFYAIPSPDGIAPSYARYYADDFIGVLNDLGVVPEILWASELYRSGQMDGAIRLILDNAALVDRINHEVSGGPLHAAGWVPFSVICPNCGKVSTTRATDWDGQTVAYSCEPHLQKWAEGCGHHGRISPFGGAGKLPWKQEWAAKWMALGVTVEGEGSDHATAGGSRHVANAVSRQVLRRESPYDVPYEFFLVKFRDEVGEVKTTKMASSKGTGTSAREMSGILPPQLLRFLLIRPQPRQAIPFEVAGATIPNLYDEYDRCAKAHFEGSDPDQARVYALAQVDDGGLEARVLPRFSTVAAWVQIPHVDPFAEARALKGADLHAADIAEVRSRVHYARLWVERYAPEEAKMAIRPEAPAEAEALTDPQRALLRGLAARLRQGRAEADALHNDIFGLGQQLGLKSRGSFEAIYLALLGKKSGPRAAWLIATQDPEFVIGRFEQVAGKSGPENGEAA